MKLNERLLQFDERKKSNKGLFIFIVVILFFIVGSIVFLNRERISNTFENDSKGNGKKTYNNSVEDTLDEGKRYDKASGLLIPSVDEEKSTYKSVSDNVIIKLEEIDGDTSGYTMKVGFSQSSEDYYMGEDPTRKGRVNRVYIDGYDTSIEPFDVEFAIDKFDEHTIHIPKTELDQLGINDFNKLTFNMTLESLAKETIYRCYDVFAYQLISVDNSKSSTIHLANFENLQIDYYKTVVDNKNTYFYFLYKDIDSNDNKYRVTNIMVNKLIINGEVYEIDNSSDLYFASIKLVYLTIPKSDIKDVESASISFVASVSVNESFYGYFVSNQMSFDVNR